MTLVVLKKTGKVFILILIHTKWSFCGILFVFLFTNKYFCKINNNINRIMIQKIEKIKNIGNYEDYIASGDVTLKK